MVEDADQVLEASRLLLALINDVLDVSKIEAGQLSLSRTSYEIERVLRNVEATIAPLASARDLDLTVQRTGERETAVGDQRRLEQVLINLAANATKFTDEGSVTIRVDARVNALRFEVEDTGIGMTEEQLESAFDAFAQPHSPHARGVSGTGLGLTISRALVEQMGGRLSATSTVGEGTTFWFELPVEAPAE